MKTEKNRKLKGTVLFTVVSVLSIMIIFMTCALAMAAAANKRSRKTYSSSQSTYTARTAIDSILAAIGTDEALSKSVSELKEEGKSISILVDMNDPSMGSVENAYIKNAGKRVIYDSTKQEWVAKTLFTISADVTIGGETTRISTNIIQDPPVQTDPPGPNPGFSTYGAAFTKQKVGAAGGTYLGMGEWEKNGVKVQWNDQTNGLRYYSWNPVGSYTSNNYFTDLKDKKYLTGVKYEVQNSSVFEAPFVVNGSFYVNTNCNILYTYQDSGVLNNGAAIWGDLSFQGANAEKFTIYGDDKIKAWIKANHTGNDFLSTPYLYVDGTIYGDKLNLGDKSGDLPFNVFCGRFEFSGNPVTVHGDIYCMDKDITSVMGSNATDLYGWASSTVNSTDVSNFKSGNLYSNGNILVSGNNQKISGDMVVAGDVTVTGSLTVSGNLVVGGKLKIKDGANVSVTGSVYCGSSDETDIVKIDTNNKTFDSANFDKKDITCTLCKISKFHADWGNTYEHGYGYMTPESLEAARKAYGVTGNDFTNKDVAEQYIDAFHGAWENNLPATKVITKYYKKGTNIEVSENDTYIYPETEYTGGVAGKRVNLVEYTKNHGKAVYPERATRDVLLGTERFLKVKGVAGRVVKYSEIPAADVTAMNSVQRTCYTGGVNIGKGLAVRDIDGSCTLTGTVTGVVNIVPEDGQEIYIHLKNIKFNCSETSETKTNADGTTTTTTTVNNDSFIKVDESKGGKVYFVYDGDVDSNYDFTDDIKSTRLVKTVYDWMNQFKFEDASRTNDGKEGTTYTNDTIKALTDENGKLVITANTTLSGNFNKPKNSSGAEKLEIYVKVPTTGEIWVTLDNANFINGTTIYVDDTDTTALGTVNFYVVGECGFSGNSKGIVSMQLDEVFSDSSKKINVFSTNDEDVRLKVYNNLGYDNTPYPILEPLKITMYAKAGAKLNLTNLSIVTAYVRAPKTLDINIVDAGEHPEIRDSIIYDGEQVANFPKIANNEGPYTRYAIIGLLNARSCQSTNDWTLIYVCPDESKGGGSMVDAEGKHRYDAVEYSAYAL